MASATIGLGSYRGCIPCKIDLSFDDVSIAPSGKVAAMGEAQRGEILVLGRTGQVATALSGIAARKSGRPIHFLAREQVDLCDIGRLAEIVASPRWQLVINAAAYTDVDRAEDEPDLARTVNALAPAAIAAACHARGIALLHLSTNYVFDGAAPDPYCEDDLASPPSVYGRTKLAGENAIRATLATHVILRTGWVFAANGRNFPRALLATGRGRSELDVVTDQWGDPSAAADIAALLLALAERILKGNGALWGTYHFTGAPGVSRFEFAEAIFDAAVRAGYGQRPRLRPVLSIAYPARAPRPRNGRLDCRRIEGAIGVPRPAWRPALEAAVRSMLAADASGTQRS